MSNEILDEVHAARERLWQRAGGTMRGLGEYLMECGRRARERGVMWIDSEEELEAIGAEVRARLAKEEAMGAVCVGEERAVYGVAGGAATGRTLKECTMQNAECRMGEGECTMQNAECTRGAGENGRTNHQTVKRSNDPTIQRKKISGRKGAPAQSEVMR